MKNPMKEREAYDTNRLDVWGHGNVRTMLFLAGDNAVVCQYRMYSNTRGGGRARNFEKAHLRDAFAGRLEAFHQWETLISKTSRPPVVLAPGQPPEFIREDAAAVFEVRCGDCTAAVYANFADNGDVVHKCVLRSAVYVNLPKGYACVCGVTDVQNANDALYYAEAWIEKVEFSFWPGQRFNPGDNWFEE